MADDKMESPKTVSPPKKVASAPASPAITLKVAQRAAVAALLALRPQPSVKRIRKVLDGLADQSFGSADEAAAAAVKLAA